MNFSTNNMHYPVRWNIKREPVYRLLDNLEHLDNFFYQGQIMLSCFETFKKNHDEMRGDSEEGNSIIGEFGNEVFNTHIVYEGGKNAFILSTTLEPTQKAIKDFKAVGAIKIINPMFFGHEISKKLPFISSGIEGKCDYKDSRVKFMEGEAGKFLNSVTADDLQNPYVIEKFQEITRGQEIFLKLKKYEHQQEYRFVWFSKEAVKKSMLINCPEAIQFCEKIIF